MYGKNAPVLSGPVPWAWKEQDWAGGMSQGLDFCSEMGLELMDSCLKCYGGDIFAIQLIIHQNLIYIHKPTRSKQLPF